MALSQLFGCNPYQRWRYYADSDMDPRIPGWRVRVEFQYLEREQPLSDSLKQFDLTLEVFPAEDEPPTRLGVDSMVVFTERTKRGTIDTIYHYVFNGVGEDFPAPCAIPSGVRAPGFRTYPIPKKIICCLYFRVVDTNSGESKTFSLDYAMTRVKLWTFLGQFMG